MGECPTPGKKAGEIVSEGRCPKAICPGTIYWGKFPDLV